MASTRKPSPVSKLRISSFIKAISILGIIIVIFGYIYWGHLARINTAFDYQKLPPSTELQTDNPSSQEWTHKIWQTSKYPVAAMSEEDRTHFQTWTDLNPDWGHEVLTDEVMESYVRDHFHETQPEMEELYFEVKDYILRSDLIRYFVMLADGGVYNDLDVGCEKPISTWVPKQFEDTAGILLGVEVDNKYGPDGRTFTNGEDLFELVNWTIMSKPNQPFMGFLVQRVMENIKSLAASKNQAISEMVPTIPDVLVTTGPAALTTAFFDYASGLTGRNVTYKNFTKITEPQIVGEVVILPIQAFGAGHQVQWAGLKQDGSQLVHHYFAGSWKGDHHDGGWQDAEHKALEEARKKKEEAKTAEKAPDKAAEGVTTEENPGLIPENNLTVEEKVLPPQTANTTTSPGTVALSKPPVVEQPTNSNITELKVAVDEAASIQNGSAAVADTVAVINSAIADAAPAPAYSAAAVNSPTTEKLGSVSNGNAQVEDITVINKPAETVPTQEDNVAVGDTKAVAKLVEPNL
ncbi:hypothetical protein HO133_001247 [Letharia lupina]|uniref:Glycosyltransferase family 32 protein n=1 Tax=Letharia lupina TaxID=560253 RepID=A0A8H6CFA3_9LECA|nr:uncharacterized protein HO133_001247 [Letharia lupina]KAF6222161.1 hypothetical protein HO133_001247 [Letharia lupina]